MQCVVSGVSRQ